MKRTDRKAWAIHTQSPEGHGFIGSSYLNAWRAAGWHPAHTGLTLALFKTRREARTALREIKGPEWGFKKARVYRVTVTIEGMPA